MIVGYLLLGVFAICGASRPPRRADFAPTPEFNSDLPLMVEGDIAVTERSLGSGTAMLAFRHDVLWLTVVLDSWFPFVGAYLRSFSSNFYTLLSLTLKLVQKNDNSVDTQIPRSFNRGSVQR